MNKAEVAKLVDQGFELDRQIKFRLVKLTEIKDRLKRYVGSGPDGPRKGILVGNGCQAEIGTGAKLAALVNDPKLLEKVRKVAGEHFETLFRYGPVQKFKDVAAAIFGRDSKSAGELEGLLKGKAYQTCEFSEIQGSVTLHP